MLLSNYIKLFTKKIDKILTFLTIFLLKIRQKTFSPDRWLLSPILRWKVCVHRPHCSQYCIDALKRFWFFEWIKYCFYRVIDCHPFWKENKFFIWGKVYDPTMYKVVFFSSAQIWVPFLEKFLDDKRFEVVWVVTTPPKPAWRWLKLTPTPVQKFVENIWKNVENFLKTPVKLKWNDEFKKWLKELDPDFIVVISYWKIIPKEILEIPKIAPINVHWSLLPKYRWASPIQSVLLDWEDQTWITIMKMNEKLDEWDIIKQLKFNIPFDWTAKEIIDKMIQVGPQFLVDTIFEYAKWEVKEIPQNHNEATYCKKIKKEDWKINPLNDNLDLIYRKYRAFILWPWIYFNNLFEWQGGKCKLFKITYLKLDKNKFTNFKNKPLFLLDSWRIVLNPSVVEIKIRPEGKKDLSFGEFIRWYIKNGDKKYHW